jgi:hypothetical protein
LSETFLNPGEAFRLLGSMPHRNLVENTPEVADLQGKACIFLHLRYPHLLTDFSET